MVLACVVLLVCGTVGTARGAPVLLTGLTTNVGGGWSDVEQTTFTNLCWAASSSNMLAYSGWNGGFADAAGVFGELSGHWSNQFGNPN